MGVEVTGSPVDCFDTLKKLVETFVAKRHLWAHIPRFRSIRATGCFTQKISEMVERNKLVGGDWNVCGI